MTNEKSRITPKPRGLAPHENSARPAGAEADTSTATAATASTGASQTTLMTAQELGQPVMDRLAFIAIKGGSIVVAPLVSEAQQSVKVYRVGVLSPGTPPLGSLDALRTPTLVRAPFQRTGWIYEEKVDGYRMLAYKDPAPASDS